MMDKSLFVAEYRGLRTRVMETRDGHVYPMGSMHECDNRDCPASYEGAPRTTLGQAGPIEKVWSAYFDMQPQDALKAWKRMTDAQLEGETKHD